MLKGPHGDGKGYSHPLPFPLSWLLYRFYWVAEKRGQADELDFRALGDDSTLPFFERVTDSP